MTFKGLKILCVVKVEICFPKSLKTKLLVGLFINTN